MGTFSLPFRFPQFSWIIFQSLCPSVVVWAPLTSSAFKHLPRIIFLLKILVNLLFPSCPRTSERILLRSGSVCFWVLETAGDHCPDWRSPKSSFSSKSFTLVLRVNFFLPSLSSFRGFQWRVVFSYEKMNEWRRDERDAPPPRELRNLHTQTLLAACLQLQFSAWIWLGTTGQMCYLLPHLTVFRTVEEPVSSGIVPMREGNARSLKLRFCSTWGLEKSIWPI